MLNEIKNQHVHLFWGYFSCHFLYLLFPKFIFFVPLAIGFLVESYQLIFKKEGWKIKDRILDLSFWGLSGLLFYLIG